MNGRAVPSGAPVPAPEGGALGALLPLASWTASAASLLAGEPLFRLLGRRTPLGDLGRARSVLVVRTDQIGDVVLSSPLLRELRRALPQARITLVVKPAVRNLVEHCPHVDEVLTFEAAGQGRTAYLQGAGAAVRMGLGRLLRRRFDVAVLPRWDADFYHGAFLCYWSGAVRRLGYREDLTPEKRRWSRGHDRLFTDLLDGSGVAHEAERGLAFASFFGRQAADRRLELWTAPEDDAFAQALLAGAGRERPLVALGPGAGEPKRCWPLERFAAVGARLAEAGTADLVLVGGPGEEALGRELKARLGPAAVDCVGRATLRQTAAVLRRCRLFVGNDSGLLHLAAAAGSSVVELSCHPANGDPAHAHSPARFGPWGVPSVVLQPPLPRAPCKDSCAAASSHCIEGISVDRAQEAVESLLFEEADDGR